MTTRGELENRVERLERQVRELKEVVQELAELAPTDMDDTPMSIMDAKTWKHPEMAIHVYEATNEVVEESPDRYVDKRKVKERARHGHEHTRSEVKATIKNLVDRDVLKEREGRIRIAKEAADIDPERLFKSNLKHAEERREYAAEKGKPVDNPDDKHDLS